MSANTPGDPRGTGPRTGPLAGITVLEIAAQGPGPFACMLLADLGARVISVERVGHRRPLDDAHQRGRESICVDIKQPQGRQVVLDLVARADVLIEGFRPGTLERLGLGPTTCHQINPGLVYGRMTGWGQDGPLAQVAGHDINYLALTGALDAIGQPGGRPVPPLNLLGDYGGGGMLLALGVVSALFERATSGLGQVVDAAMVDGVGVMLAPFLAMAAKGSWNPNRGSNLLDGGAHFYRTYRTADDRWMSVGAIEAKFYLEFLAGLGLAPDDLGPQMDKAGWPAAAERVAEIFASRTRQEWVEEFSSRDACVAPVLDLVEAVGSDHASARGMYSRPDALPFPAPAPRFDRTSLDEPHPPEPVGASTETILDELGIELADRAALRAARIVG